MPEQLIPTQTVRSMATAYAVAVEKMKLAFESVSDAKSTLELMFGGNAKVMKWNRNMGSLDESLYEMKKSAWLGIIKQTGIDSVMSTSRRKEFDKQLVSGETPEPTEENIMGFLLKMRGDSSKYVKESISQLYNQLRPCGSGYATNSKFEVQEKVILEHLIDARTKYQSLGLRYQSEGDAHLLDNIFHLLDGQGMPKYPNDLVTSIKKAIKEGLMECETPYFKCKWFYKGTIHITFKRMDLVTEINRIAGGGMLKPAGA